MQMWDRKIELPRDPLPSVYGYHTGMLSSVCSG